MKAALLLLAVPDTATLLDSHFVRLLTPTSALKRAS
jgi:hypothetical protein